jgi:hypothetical protein
MKSRRFTRVLALCVLGFPLHAPCPAASPAPLDLGRNLAYLRLHRLPDDLPALAAAWGGQALIIDLRHTAGDAATGFADALPLRPRPAPLFVLVGPDSPAGALAGLRARAPALITLGIPAPGLIPDIAPAVTAEDDRRAYDALDAGASVDSLINEATAAKRFDEAALVSAKDHDSSNGDEPDSPVEPQRIAPAPAADGAPTPDAAPAAPKDLILQRAVHLHRALLALGKLPRG